MFRKCRGHVSVSGQFHLGLEMAAVSGGDEFKKFIRFGNNFVS